MPPGAMLLLLGVLLLGVGLAVLFLRREETDTLRRVRRIPRTPIASAPDRGLVKIGGTVIEGEQGCLRSPVTDREGVVVDVEVSFHHSTDAGWRPLLRAPHRRAFYVDDGSGELARIEPEGALVVTPAERVGDDYLGPLEWGEPTRSSVTPEMRAWVASRASGPLPKVLLIEEERFAPGGPIFAMGPAVRERRPDGSRLLVLSHRGSGESELLLSNTDEAGLMDEAGRRRRKIWLLVAMGACMIAASLSLAILGVGW